MVRRTYSIENKLTNYEKEPNEFLNFNQNNYSEKNQWRVQQISAGRRKTQSCRLIKRRYII